MLERRGSRNGTDFIVPNQMEGKGRGSRNVTDLLRLNHTIPFPKNDSSIYVGE